MISDGKNVFWFILGHGVFSLSSGVTPVVNMTLHGYVDADWAGSVVDRKSTSGCCFTLGFASISWMSGKQKSVALSTVEAKYIAASMACCEAV